MSKHTSQVASAKTGEYIADASAGATFAKGVSQGIWVASDATRLDFTMGGEQIRFDNVLGGRILPIQATAVVATVSSAVSLTVLHNN